MPFKPAHLLVTLALAATASPWLAQPAFAQRAAFVQSVDEPGRNPFQESVSSVDCRTSQFCNLNYSAVPAGKRLVLTNITGYVDTGAGTYPNGILSSNLGGTAYASVNFTATRGSPAGSLGTRMYINERVLAYFGPGEIPHVFMGVVSTSDTFSGGAHVMLSGYYINLP